IESPEARYAELARGLDDLLGPIALQDRDREGEPERELGRDGPPRDDLPGDLRRRDRLELDLVIDEIGDEDDALPGLQPEHGGDLPRLLTCQERALRGRAVDEEPVHPAVLAGQLEGDPVALLLARGRAQPLRLERRERLSLLGRDDPGDDQRTVRGEVI